MKEFKLNLRTGSREDPIRIDEKFDVEEIEHMRDRTLYVEKEKQFTKEFWKKVYWNNLAVVLVEL